MQRYLIDQLHPSVNIDTLGLAYQRVVNNLMDYQTSTLPFRYAEELTRWGSEHEFCALPLLKVYGMLYSRISLYIKASNESTSVPAYMIVDSAWERTWQNLLLLLYSFLLRLMLVDPRYSPTEVLAVLDNVNVTVDDLPSALAHYMDDIIVSISRLECYITRNVDRDGVSNINIRLLWLYV